MKFRFNLKKKICLPKVNSDVNYYLFEMTLHICMVN